MREEHDELVSDLIDIAAAGLPGADRLSQADLIGSLRRLIRETECGLSEYTGFQNMIPSVAPSSPRAGDE
jgi:hypothetical protein